MISLVGKVLGVSEQSKKLIEHLPELYYEENQIELYIKKVLQLYLLIFLSILLFIIM